MSDLGVAPPKPQLPIFYGSQEEAIAVQAAPPAPQPAPQMPVFYGSQEEAIAAQSAAPAAPAPSLAETVLPPTPMTSAPVMPTPQPVELPVAAGPPPERSGFFTGIGAGGQEALRLGTRTLAGQAFEVDPNAPPPETGDEGYWYRFGKGIGYSAPTLAAGLGGGALGFGLGSLGGPAAPISAPAASIVGAGLGVGAMSLAQDLAPTYAQQIQAGKTHDEAVTYAWEHGIATGVISGATAWLPGPFKSAAGQILYQTFFTQPVSGAAVRGGVPLVMGEPLPSAGEFVEGAGQDVMAGAGFAGAHAVARRGVQAVRPTPPAPPPTARSDVDIGAREAFAPTGLPAATEQAGVPAPAPSLSRFPLPGEVTRTEIAPEQFPPSAAPVPPAGEPYAQTVVPAGPARIETAPVVPRLEATEAAPPPYTAPPAETPVGAEVIPRQELPPTSPVERSTAPLAPETPLPPTLRPPEPVIGEPVDRPGATAGRPAEPAPVGEAGPARVVPEPETLPGRPGVGTDLGERPGDTQGARPVGAEGQPAERPAVPPDVTPARPAEATTTEPAAPVTTFTTAKGSTYTVHEDGTTTRDKSFHPEHGAADQGLQPRSEATFYVKAEDAQKLGEVQTQGGPARVIAPVGDGRWGVKYLEGKDTGKFEGRTVVTPVSDKPAAGLTPIEIFNGGKRVHFGNEITEVRAAPATEPTARETAVSRLTTEPDDVVPGQHVAKNPAGEVVGKGASPEAARADAQARQNAPYALEAPAREQTTTGQTEPRLSGPGRLEDQAAAPGTREEAGTTGPRETRPSPAPAERMSPQLAKLTAARDALAAKTKRTPNETLKLSYMSTQVGKLRAKEGLSPERTFIPTPEDLVARRPGRKDPFSGPPEPRTQRDARDYHYNDGTSVFADVFREAGHDPNVAVNRPIGWQTRVLTQHMQRKFGFASVEVVGDRKVEATPVDQKIARDAMLDMTRAMVDGMAALNLPHSAASLNGRLKLVIEPEGSRSYYGAYVPAEGEIRITGGANSFGHEWTHAIDHDLAKHWAGDPSFNRLLTQVARGGQLDPKADPVSAAFAKVINTMFYDDAALAAGRVTLELEAAKIDKAGAPTKGATEAQRQLDLLERAGSQLRIQPSRFRSEARALDTGRSKPYYQTVYEMLARAHEAYIAREITNTGRDPRGIVMPDEAYIQETRQAFELAYPKGGDRMAIFQAFDDLHNAMRREQTLSNGEPPGNFSNYQAADPYHYPITAPQAKGTWIERILKAEIARYSTFTKNLADEALYDKNRPSSRLSFGAKFADGLRAVTYSSHGMMETIIARAPDAAKPALTKIMDLVAGAPGEGRYSGEHFEKAVRVRARGWMNQFANIMENNGLKPYSLSQAGVLDNAMLRHAMVTSETVFEGQTIPANIMKAGRDMRLLMDQMWRASHDANMDVGYASRYYPRLYDLARVFDNPGGFKTASRRMHSFMFDQEMGTPGSDPQALLERWTTLSRADRNLAQDPNLPTQMTELNQNLRRQREIEENPNPTPAEQAELQTLKTDARQLAVDTHDSLRDHIAEMATTDWHNRLVLGNHADFDTTGPSGSYLNARVLPPEADIIMRDFMHTEMTDAIPNYIHAVARRISFTERFGQQGEGLKTAMEALVNIPGMRAEDLRKFEGLIHNVTGRNADRTPFTQDLARVTNVIHAMGSLALMPRAMWSSLAEPMSAALVTGDLRTGFKIFAHQFGQMMRTASAAERTEFAQFHNVMTSAMYDSIMLSRMTADYSDSPRLNRLMTNYYRITGLTQLTNSQRAGAASASNWFVAKLARDYQDPGTSTRRTNARDNATRWFNELGVPEHMHDEFAQWMVDLGGKLPDIKTLQTDPMKTAYGNAIYNLTDRLIQDPYKVDRATLSSVPVIGLAYQLMSFNYQFQRNVLNPLWNNIEHSYGRAKLAAETGGAGRLGATAQGLTAAGGTLAHSAAMASAVLGAGLITTALRQYLFAPDQWEKHEQDGTLEDYLVNLTFQRSGLNGTLDPIIQVFTNLRYNADLTSLMDGASMNWFSKNAQDVIQPFVTTNDSPNTNTRLFNQARGAFNLIGVPAAAYGLTMLGAAGGPITRAIAGGALQYGTSPGSAAGFAEFAVGSPKGAERSDAGGGSGDLPGLPELPGLPGVPGFGSKGGADEPDPAGGFQGGAWGLVDDIALPAWRYGSAALGSVPRAVKAGALGAAALYGGSKYMEATEPFRGQPGPDK